MIDFPVRLLVVGYGLSAGLSAIAFAGGAGALAAALGFWLGGAVAVLVLGVVVAWRRRKAPPAPTVNLVLEEELARWERDRLADSAEAASARGRVADTAGA